MKGRRDFVRVKVQETKMRSGTQKGRMESFNDRLPAYLNCLFHLRRHDGKLFKLAYVSLLGVVGNLTPHGPEGMSVVETWTERNKVVWLRSLEVAVHLVPLEPSDKWIGNNRIDYQNWKTIYDDECGAAGRRVGVPRNSGREHEGVCT